MYEEYSLQDTVEDREIALGILWDTLSIENASTCTPDTVDTTYTFNGIEYD